MTPACESDGGCPPDRARQLAKFAESFVSVNFFFWGKTIFPTHLHSKDQLAYRRYRYRQSTRGRRVNGAAHRRAGQRQRRRRRGNNPGQSHVSTRRRVRGGGLPGEEAAIRARLGQPVVEGGYTMVGGVPRTCACGRRCYRAYGRVRPTQTARGARHREHL